MCKKVDGDGNLDNLSKEKPVINLGKGDSLDFDFKGKKNSSLFSGQVES